jgi:predicted nucleic acid-binding protein
MIIYLDASALVKRYIAEVGSKEVDQIIAEADLTGSALISRAEVAAALAKAVRVNALQSDEAGKAIRRFRAQWNDLIRMQMTETLIARADTLAWDYGLRGYDAVHLAAAHIWQETIGEPIVLATFDRRLWTAGQSTGLSVWPDDLNLLV